MILNNGESYYRKGRQTFYKIVALANGVCLQFDFGYASHKRNIERIASPGFVHSLPIDDDDS